MSDEELTEEELALLRRKRMQELQRAAVDEQRHAQQAQQLEAQRQALLRQILTPEARQRLTNIRMVRPDFAEQLEAQLIQLAQAGRVQLPITDEQLKQALEKMQSQRKEIKIRRM